MITYENFLKYHRENPQIYVMFEKFSLQVIASGRKNFGVGAIAERMRWYSAIETVGDCYKINNNYRAFYARLFEEQNPQHIGFFRKRRSVADQKALFQ